MNAVEAHKLIVGDWVLFCAGTHTKRGEIKEINWPRFTIRSKYYNGDEMIRVRRYQSLVKCNPVDAPSINSPDWLIWKKPNA